MPFPLDLLPSKILFAPTKDDDHLLSNGSAAFFLQYSSWVADMSLAYV